MCRAALRPGARITAPPHGVQLTALPSGVQLDAQLRRTSGCAAAQRMHEVLHDAQLEVLRHCLQLAVLQALYQLPWAQPQICLLSASDRSMIGSCGSALYQLVLTPLFISFCGQCSCAGHCVSLCLCSYCRPCCCVCRCLWQHRQPGQLQWCSQYCHFPALHLLLLCLRSLLKLLQQRRRHQPGPERSCYRQRQQRLMARRRQPLRRPVRHHGLAAAAGC